MFKVKQIKQLLLDEPTKNFIVIILITIIYLGLFFCPKIKQFFVLFREASQLKAEIVTTRREWADIDALKVELLRLNERKNYYEKRLPGRKEVPAVLEYLSSAAKELNVRISEIKPVEQEVSGGQIFYSVPILLKAECEYHQLGRFLNELEKADRFMKISDIKMIASPKQTGTLYIQLIIVTYVMSQG